MRYVYKGSTYVIIGTTKMKNPVTREWQDAIIYSETIGGTMSSDMYTRESKEFFERFKKQ